MIKIFLDDERTPRDVTWVGLSDPEEYQIARNFQEFRDLVRMALKAGYIPEVSFDHDLQDFHRVSEILGDPDLLANVKAYGKPTLEDPDLYEMTGMSCMNYLCNAVLAHRRHEEAAMVFHTFHTKNPVMKERMANEWEFFSYFEFDDHI